MTLNADLRPIPDDGLDRARYGGFETAEDMRQMIDVLRARGIRAVEDYSGGCASDDEGHYHPHFIKVFRLTPVQARKLLR